MSSNEITVEREELSANSSSRDYVEDDENDNTTRRSIKCNKAQLQKILDNLIDVENELQSVLQTHRHGEYGFLTREWGFTAPGGLGGQLKGKFYPWEMKLRRCKDFFWPIECYEAMEHGPDFGRPDSNMVKDLPPEGEQLYGNTRLHDFLKDPPVPAVELYEEDYHEYRSAARIFLLLGTLSHLYGNSAPGGPKNAPLPRWIEDPLIEVAERLCIEPTLSGHFLVQENWIWKNDAEEESGLEGQRRRFEKRSSITLSKRRLSKNTSKRAENKIVETLLRECECEDRVRRIKLYKDCFLGSQCVDVVVNHRFADTREDAVRLLRKINRAYKIFAHVTNDNYELMDKQYFYRFRKQWRTKRVMAQNGELQHASIDVDEDENATEDEDRSNRSVSFGKPQQYQIDQATDDINSYMKKNENWQAESNSNSITAKSVARLSSSYNGARIVSSKHTSMHDTNSIIQIMANVRIKDRRHQLFRLYKNCFVGKELIDVLMDHKCGTTRKECLELALSINQRYKLFEHVKRYHVLKDKRLFYRFTEAFKTMTEDQIYASTLGDAGGGGGPMMRMSTRRVSFSEQSLRPILESNDSPTDFLEEFSESNLRLNSADNFTDENLRSSFSYSDYGDSYDAVLGLEEEMEFSLDNITMLYPAFGNNHERINQLVPACMGFSLSSLPFDVLDIVSVMRNVLEAELNFEAEDDDDNYEINRLYDLVYKVAFSVSKCKEEFQQMSTDPKKRSFNSKYVSIKQTQPLSNGVLVRRRKNEEPELRKGTTGTQFPYFHILDWLLGRYQYKGEGKDTERGLVAAVGSIDETFPRPQREFIHCLSKLEKSSTLRGFLEVIGKPKELLTAYNHLIECYAGEGGVLQAHCRKLYSYIHNNVQSSTSGTNHLASSKEQKPESEKSKRSGCPMHSFSNESKEPERQGCPIHFSSNASIDSDRSGCPISLTSNDSKESGKLGCPIHSSLIKSKEPERQGCPIHFSSNASIDSERSGCPISLTSNESSGKPLSVLDIVEDGVPPILEAARQGCTVHFTSNGNKESERSGCQMSSSLDESKESERPGCPMHSSLNESKEPERQGCPMSLSYNKDKEPERSGCPMSLSSNASSNAIDNHKFAIMMFKHMRMAADDRWKLRLPPLMNEVGKVIYSTSESGGFTTVALDLSGTGLLYEYGDVVKVILPNDDKQTLSWLHSLKSMNQEFFSLNDMIKLQKKTGNGWGWDGLWEALGWYQYEENGGSGVPLEMIARYIEQGNIRDETSKKPCWVHSPLDLSSKGSSQMFASPPPIQAERIVSLEPVSPRIYSVSGVEIDRVFLLVSKPDDLARHHGYSSMSDPTITKVHCSFSPATFFLVPPKDVNLVCIASGTGISPFVGLVDAIGSRTGSYTIVHQCKSSDMFMCNSQTWLDFTAMNPGSIVMGYISGDRSRRNCPMRYIIRNGAFEETTVLRRRNKSAYYFECEMFEERIFETYRSGELNLAYCCGGVKSSIIPLQTFADTNGMEFEFTCESYGVPSTLTKASNLLSQIGGTIIDLNHVSPIHPGGDQILHQANDIVTSMNQLDNKKKSNTPDHSIAFYELHPHAYNLHRCLRTPADADSKAFAKFLERQAMSKSILGNMADKYTQEVLSSPESSKIVKIAAELQSSAIQAQQRSGDTERAIKSASQLRKLLDHIPDDDDDTERWGQSLELVPSSKRNSSVIFDVPDGDGDVEKWGQSHDLVPSSKRKSNIVFNIPDGDKDVERHVQSIDVMPPSRRKSSVVFNVPEDDDDSERWGKTHDFVPRSRRKSSVVLKKPEL